MQYKTLRKIGLQQIAREPVFPNPNLAVGSAELLAPVGRSYVYLMAPVQKVVEEGPEIDDGNIQTEDHSSFFYGEALLP